ncbi:16S rRNA (guanine(966)-N(2))-methyltransferase RsmD [Actinomycetospora sp. NBRC 106375]|uniref:16S rRNA (guanine(966)-N(2))-methyltransferase RsmD n=1 Tax=Actinomycetospora sp. NBRC 106375 TaxID=3032207 RepID=UPI0024A6052C|nr:16S rRNA (guanine(966)-N(2))-methyltransferase RsmD [Actinomycetospora sp. NBRC 106375]GLZ44974.1 16S rRNA (guanine(966)-N(2))-methyltransferase RsmD [Actinomycetospora sp. NBRC 106375]
MTRIIGGVAGGRTISVPPTGTRPTADRVREAVFSALEARGAIEDAEVLDLFAGSGALGIEALSRGASTAILVERDPRACAVIQSNVGVAGVHGALVRRSAVLAYLRKTPGPVDLVFVDPPYADPVDDVLALLPRWVRAGGVVVLERDTRSPAPVWPDGLEPEDPRTYGETTLHLATAT